MNEERDPELSPEKMAQAREVAEKVVRELRQIFRDLLVLGKPIDAVKTACINMGIPKESIEKGIESLREQLQEQATINRDFEVANTLDRLEIVFSLAMKEGELGTALQVIRERARFTRAAEFVKFTSSAERHRVEPTECDRALDDLGSVGREQLNLEITALILESARKAREKKAT